MALKCPECRSLHTTTGLGDTISCTTCGFHGDHAHVGETGYVAPAKKTAAKKAVK
jgi:hypothetical protein